MYIKYILHLNLAHNIYLLSANFIIFTITFIIIIILIIIPLDILLTLICQKMGRVSKVGQSGLKCYGFNTWWRRISLMLDGTRNRLSSKLPAAPISCDHGGASLRIKCVISVTRWHSEDMESTLMVSDTVELLM